MRLSLIPFALALVLASGAGGLAGCWSDAEQIDGAVWSDDDTSQAYLKLLYEESSNSSPLSGTTNKRNFRHQLFVQQAGGGWRALTGERANQAGPVFYYMRRAGYILIEVLEDNGSRWDVVHLSNGSSQTIGRFTRPGGPAIPCHHFEALPSPDGLLIALIERTAAAGGDGGPAACNDGDTTVTFLTAEGLTPVAQHSWPMHAMPEVVWGEDGELYVWGYLDGSWRVDLGAGPVSAAVPSCTWPRTSSSPLSSGGVLIGPGETDSAPVVVVDGHADNCR